MARHLIIVDRLSDWRWPTGNLIVKDIDHYLQEEPTGNNHKKVPYVVNLCRRYSYLSGGYYCSLLAEARSQVPMPTVADILSLGRKTLHEFALNELETVLAKAVRRQVDLPDRPFDLTVCFGQADDERFRRLGEETFDLLRYPILRIRLIPGEKWRLSSIRPLGLHQLPRRLDALFLAGLLAYTRVRSHAPTERPPALYQLAILYDPAEAVPPSDAAALKKFMSAARALRMDTELITKKDYRRLPEFDALFIRTMTHIDHYTYRFARKAEQEGLIVIDDSMSILRCTNKVYLSELLARNGVPAPKSRTINRLKFGHEDVEALERELGYPIILKIPDGAFSKGVLKARDRGELLAHAAQLLRQSRLILAQEYIYTTFDWRVGVLDGKPLFACQYKMAGKHWQIVDHRPDGSFRYGDFATLALKDVPKEVIEVATRAACLMGQGLYGVDLKETEKGVVVIEVNDNPNLDGGVEDKVLKDELYTQILKEFIRRIDGRT